MHKWNVEELKVQIGIIIRLARLRKQLSQFQLGNEVDLTKDYVGIIERGRTNPTIEVIVKICNFLDIELSTLFTPLIDYERAVLETEIEILEKEFKNKNKRRS